MLYQSNHVINHDICYFCVAEFVQQNIYTKLGSSTTPAIALATPRKATLYHGRMSLFKSEHMVGARVVDTRHMCIN